MINNRSNNSNQNGSERKFEIQIESNYDFKADDYGLLSSRIHNILSETTKHISLNDDFVFKISALESSNPNVFISDKSNDIRRSDSQSLSIQERSILFKSENPKYTLDFLKINPDLKSRLLKIKTLVDEKNLIFNEWNLRSIDPCPNLIFNFYGLPGTGKTLAAHALAHHMEVPILVAKYSQIEDKYVAEDAKNVEALFLAAKRDNALLFIDEADALFSSRVVSPSQGAEYGINALRATLLSSIDEFDGAAILATNLVENIDSAFKSRMEYIEFELPTEELRYEIWKSHIPEEMPVKNLNFFRISSG